ncbi:MAG: hypothetical protein B6I22_08460 [Desulfobacteraceae bacterium 4572_123]|nr:MAG: hypothetical protein B6I22_08460 [Desulfobacteraceae bacterium 4572_123]
MRSEYKKEDLGIGKRGKYYNAYRESNNLVRLIPEVAKAFPTEKAVNDALLALIKAARSSVSGPDSTNAEGLQ